MIEERLSVQFSKNLFKPLLKNLIGNFLPTKFFSKEILIVLKEPFVLGGP